MFSNVHMPGRRPRGSDSGAGAEPTYLCLIQILRKSQLRPGFEFFLTGRAKGTPGRADRKAHSIGSLKLSLP